MKIWILEIGEPLPLEENARLHRYGLFSQWLASHGHQVTWWTSSFSHAPKKHFVESDELRKVNGVEMRFIRGPGYDRNVSFARIKHQKHFAEAFTQQARALLSGSSRPDVILAPVPTIDGADAAVRLGVEIRVPVIADVRDLWPDELRDLAPAPLRGLASLALRKSYAKMNYVCSHATAIAGVSESYLEYGLSQARRSRQELDFVFPLGYSPQTYSAEKLGEAEAWFAGLKIPPSAFVTCFFGTIGKFFDLSTVIECARELGEGYYFVLGGDGSGLEDFKREASGLKNVIFPGWLGGAQIKTVMSHSHAGLAPYSAQAKMSLPNKPFEYMSAGLPVVSSIQKELKNYLESASAGFTYKADVSSELSAILRKLRSDEGLRRKTGENAAKLFQNEFSTEKVFAKALANIEHVVQTPRLKEKELGL